MAARRGRLLSGLLLALALTGQACARPLVEPAVDATPTPLPTPAGLTKPVFEAKRGSIIETVKGNGRLAPSREATLYFDQGGRLKRLFVELNSRVKKDQVLAELDVGDLGTRVETARITTEIAQIGLQRAIAASNAGDADVQTAAAKIVQAEAQRAQAVAGLGRAATGSTEADMRAAEAGIAAGRAAVEKAQADLAKLVAPRNQEDIAAAKGVVDKAASVVQKAQADYDRVASRPDVAGRPEAVALQQATIDYQAAKARLALAQTPPKPADVAAAQQAVSSAQAALDSAIARRDQLAAGPLPQDVDSARANVTAATAAIDAARAGYEAKVAAAAVGAANFDVQVAQKQVEIASVQLRTLQDQLTASQIRAPFDGIVTSTSGREGDPVAAYAPVVVLADPTSVWIAMDVNAPDMPKVAVGQAAVVTMDAFKGQKFDSKVIGLPSVAAGLPQTATGQPQSPSSKSVTLDFKPPGPVDLGALAAVTITTQKKDDVVLVPNTTVRKAGGRTFVQIDAGGGRKREVDVQVGIATDQETEIVKGIKEGTRVVSQ